MLEKYRWRRLLGTDCTLAEMNFTMFTPRLAISCIPMILRHDHMPAIQGHVRGVRVSFSNILSPGGSIAGAWALERRHSFPSISPSRRLDNIGRASQGVEQGVPAGVPRSYRALADHGNVPLSILHHRARGRRSMK